MSRFIICDIDGTIADASHRLHHIKQEPKNWDLFHDGVDRDTPHRDIRRLLKQVEPIADIVYLTGRMERTRSPTLQWLTVHGFPVGVSLLMRRNGDHRPDYTVKYEYAKLMGFRDDNVWFALEDRDQVVKMWRDMGIRCLQVANGAF